MHTSFDTKDFITEFARYKKFFRKPKNLIRIYASNGKIEFASFSPRTKIEIGSFVNANTPESGEVTLNFPAANFYDMCETISTQYPNNSILKLSVAKSNTSLSITSESAKYNLPILQK